MDRKIDRKIDKMYLEKKTMESYFEFTLDSFIRANTFDQVRLNIQSSLKDYPLKPAPDNTTIIPLKYFNGPRIKIMKKATIKVFKDSDFTINIQLNHIVDLICAPLNLDNGTYKIFNIAKGEF